MAKLREIQKYLSQDNRKRECLPSHEFPEDIIGD
jgi:hypothetical protein